MTESVSPASPVRHQAHAVDFHVGERVRMRRKRLGLSQTDLAGAIGVTFQQVQKYERGTNRISASTLYEISSALKVPISYFFEGFAGGATSGQIEVSRSEQYVHDLLMTSEGIELAEAFPRIKSDKTRRLVADLVRQMADDNT